MEKEHIEIVLIEDEEDILELLEYHLSKEGYQVTGFLSTENVERFLEEENPSLMIVDRNLPGTEGGEFVLRLRQAGYKIPIIFLTARDKESDLEEGFRSGGDDYITKPFSTKELLLRIEALLRRSGITSNNIIRYKDLVLDIQKHQLFVDQKAVELTNLEFRLLHVFVKNPKQPLDRDFLRDEVWGNENTDFHEKTINVALNRLKKKIDPAGEKNYFAPVWGVGYKLL
ncbi:MAG: response regulator transcription factor [Sulfurovum sp.]|nr:response regulator transcription factor [Sulfurovum sp.]MDD3601940.1 response regulator transcription factor [Sulfurovum sp.]